MKSNESVIYYKVGKKEFIESDLFRLISKVIY